MTIAYSDTFPFRSTVTLTDGACNKKVKMDERPIWTLSSHSTRQQRPATRATRARPNADQVLTNKPPAYDYPPAYDNAVRVHQAQSGQQKTEAVPLSMLNRMKTREAIH